MIEQVTNIKALRNLVRKAKSNGLSVGLVPTMGALHEGHLSLCRAAVDACDCAIISIFVNPTQFAEGEDLDAYPRPLQQDLEKAFKVGIRTAFTPDAGDVYPDGLRTFVDESDLSTRWEGAHRPSHFRGVLTIVAKLFNMVQPDHAWFGQKDLQQFRLIEQMVADLDLAVQLHMMPIVREADGLALSSRNVYLSDEDRERAVSLSRALDRAESLIAHCDSSPALIRSEMNQILLDAGADVDYAEVVDSLSLLPATACTGAMAAIIAARIGTTRLIDNRMLDA